VSEISDEKAVSATTFATTNRNRRWHYALLVWFVASFAFATPSFATTSFANAAAPVAGHDHAQVHSMHDGTMDAGQLPISDMPVAHDHAAMQCSMDSCVATSFGTLQNGAFVRLTTVSTILFSAADTLMRSLYLDSDPPVPKA
jgi:hypothetical protein